MRKPILVIVVIGFCIFIATNVYSDSNKMNNLECTPKNILLCEVNKNKCATVPVVNVDGAYLIKVNLKKKYAETFEGDKKISEAKIERIERHDELVFLSGYRNEFHGKRLPHSWNAIIDPASGQLTYTSVASGVGFMLSGVCTESRENK